MYDTNLAIQNKAIFFNELKHCKEINYKKWVKRSKWKKIIESIMRLFAPLM
jgi:cardiolipin synthase